jgi:hypothetical protein
MRASTREAIAQAAEASTTLSELLAGAGFNEGVGSPQAAKLLSMSNHAEAAARALERLSKVRVLRVGSEASATEAKAPSTDTHLVRVERIRAILSGVPDTGILKELAATDESEERMQL